MTLTSPPTNKELETLIKNFRERTPNWKRYLEGDCAFFALALQEILGGWEQADIVSLWVDIGTASSPCWLHDAVAFNDRVWDVEGISTFPKTLKRWEAREEGSGYYWMLGTGIEPDYALTSQEVEPLKLQLLGN